MKSFSMMIVAGAAALAMWGCGSSGASSSRTTAIAKLTGNATAGKTVYTQNCATCHGADAKSGTAGKNLPGESADESYDQIINGGGGMQSFSSLSDQNIADVYAYIQTLK